MTKSARAVVVVLYPPGPAMGRRYELQAGGAYVVGRAAESQIALDAGSVSRQHARIHHGPHGWVIEDLGSTIGTWVNEARIATATLLRDGFRVRIGTAILKFLNGADVDAEYHEEIYKMSIVDGLTGVHNERYFLEFMERELAAAARYEIPLSLIVFDVDGLKRINEAHGHHVGDSVLRELAGRLRPRMRREDLLARIGGEEFACVLIKTPGAGAMTFAEYLRQIVARAPFAYDRLSLPVTVSVGVATFHGNAAITPDEFMRRSAQCLHAAKHAGGNRVFGV